MNADLVSRLDSFIEQALRHRLPSTIYDPGWPSPCVVNTAPETEQPVQWRPVQQQPASDMFQRLEHALEIDLHPDIATWYTHYWSNPIPARHPDGDLTLLFCWNEQDMERLRGNLLGHLMAKQKQRLPLTLFFACTDGDEFMSIDNRDGSVWLERPGKKPVRRLADSLEAFLATLTPLPIPDSA